MAELLLHIIGRLGPSKQLFLVRLDELDPTSLIAFDRSILKLWQSLKYTTDPDVSPGIWPLEEPLVS